MSINAVGVSSLVAEYQVRLRIGSYQALDPRSLRYDAEGNGWRAGRIACPKERNERGIEVSIPNPLAEKCGIPVNDYGDYIMLTCEMNAGKIKNAKHEFDRIEKSLAIKATKFRNAFLEYVRVRNKEEDKVVAYAIQAVKATAGEYFGSFDEMSEYAKIASRGGAYVWFVETMNVDEYIATGTRMIDKSMFVPVGAVYAPEPYAELVDKLKVAQEMMEEDERKWQRMGTEPELATS